MIRVDFSNAYTRVNFGMNEKKSDKIAPNAMQKNQEARILSAVDALLLYSTNVNETARTILGELKTIAAQNYPASSLNILEKRALEASKNLPVPIVLPQKPLSIWGDLYLDLQSGTKLSKTAKTLMSKDIASSLGSDGKMKETSDPNIWSISYEYTNPVGGQTDIARQLPQALNKAGAKTIAITPMYKIYQNGKPVNYIKEEDGELFYISPNEKTKIKKVWEGEIKTADKTDNFSVYWGQFGKDKQETLFLYDDDMFDFGNVQTPMVYQDLAHSPERARMAQFNNMTYELLSLVKQGKIKLPNGEELRAPNKLIAHEAWQSGGLLSKLRFYSRAQESTFEINKDTGEYLREIADNTAVIIHNLGDGYQGQSWDKNVMEKYFNILYNDYARDIVENSCIADVSPFYFGLFGTPSQRVGFYENVLNPAHSACVLAKTIGPVSQGYQSEIINNKISSKLDTIMQIKAQNGSLVAFPNGVDKKDLCADRKNVEILNRDLGKKLEEIFGKKVKIQPYIENLGEDIDEINAEEFANKKDENKKLFVGLLKNSTNSQPTPFIHNEKSANYYQGEYDIDIDNITYQTPIFSMASRLDSQKGFDTMIDAYCEVAKSYDENDPNMPVLLISGGGDKNLANYIQTKKDELKEHGKRILFTQERISNSGLMLMNMTTRNCMPSDFEPYGISELKGLYAGSHVITTQVGGMRDLGEVSRKIYSLDKYGAEKANAITVEDYEFMCLASDWEKPNIRKRNAKKLAQAMKKDIKLGREDSTKMDINALKTDVSWDKGAVQNYLEKLNVKIEN